MTRPLPDAPPAPTAGESAHLIFGRIAEEVSACLRAGGQPDVEALAARYPELASQVRELVGTLLLLQPLGAEAREFVPGTGPGGRDPEAGRLGDFRLIREVGRGGMGVVYEAEQISLSRRVALKVLPFAATMDPRHLQRFRNESLAAAALDHPHIVEVHGVGVERGVHYYAMRYVEGQTLAEVIRDLRRLAGHGPEAEGPADADQTGPYREGAGRDTRPVARLSTQDSHTAPAFFRSVAQLGAEVAEALDHAHQQGIVHRDVKPSNLLLDGRGKAWVTDFGLAHVEATASLTITGDLIGTVRYMSPEQALAKRVPVDHRTDVYSLGATLYELLTLEPAFAGDNRQELLRQIAFEEPRQPRRLNRAIPAELETIVLKAMEKNPADRYATAQELADDLKRYLADEPIRAKRPSLAQRGRKWVRRHRALVRSAAAVMLLASLSLGGSIGWAVRDRAALREEVERDREARRTALEGEVGRALGEVEAACRAGKLPDARTALDRAAALAGGGEASEDLKRRVSGWQAHLAIAERLEAIRLDQATVKEGKFDYAGADRAYREAFRQYGLPVETMDPGEAARRIEESPIKGQLVAGLDAWAMTKSWAGVEGGARLLDIAGRADGDAWREKVREAVVRKDTKALESLAAEQEVLSQPLASLQLLALFLADRDRAPPLAIEVMRKARERHPGDFWINYDLGFFLLTTTWRVEEALGYLRAAQALRPENSAVHTNIARALNDLQRWEEAEAEAWKAVGLDPNSVQAQFNLAFILTKRPGKRTEAVGAYRKVIELDPRDPAPHYNLGLMYQEARSQTEAIACFKEATRLAPHNGGFHNTLAQSLARRRRWTEAVASYKEAIRAEPEDFTHHRDLATLLVNCPDRTVRDPARAVEAARKVIELKNDAAVGWYLLGQASCRAGDAKASIEALEKAVALGKKPGSIEWFFLAMAHGQLGNKAEARKNYDQAVEWMDKYAARNEELLRLRAEAGQLLGIPPANHPSGGATGPDNSARAYAHYARGSELLGQGKLPEAEAAFREAVRLDPAYFPAHFNLGHALFRQGKFAEAEVHFRETVLLNPTRNNGQVYWMLYRARHEQGKFREALTALQDLDDPASGGAGAGVSVQEVKRRLAECERLVGLEARLPEVLQGKARARDFPEQIGFAEVCSLKRLHAGAARFYQEAFTTNPSQVRSLIHGPRAARVAALAGFGCGEDAGNLGEAERARWRKQALDWLRTGLEVQAKVLERPTPESRKAVRLRLENQQRDREMAKLRGPTELGKLPEAERAEWQKYWADFEALLRQAREKDRP